MLNDDLEDTVQDLGGFTPIIDSTTGEITGYKTTIGGADTVFPFSKNSIEYVDGAIGAPIHNATIVAFPVDSFYKIDITSGNGMMYQFASLTASAGTFKMYYNAPSTIMIDDYFDAGTYFDFNSYGAATIYRLYPRT